MDAQIYILVSHGLNPRDAVNLIAHELKHLTEFNDGLSAKRKRFVYSEKDVDANEAARRVEEYYFD